jgi:hypothetical protein
MTTYIVQASRGGSQLPTFFLDGDMLGIVDVAVAARRGLDVITPHGTSGAINYLRETMLGSLEALDINDVAYHVHASVAEAALTAQDSANLIAGRLLFAAQSGDTSLDRGTLSRAAELCVTKGPDFARGFVEGLWYTLGNRRDERHPMGYHPTWTVARMAFGE